MGGIALMHAQDHFFDTLEERVKEADDLEEVVSLYERCIGQLSMMCADEVALDNFSQKIAVEDSSVESPGDTPSDAADR